MQMQSTKPEHESLWQRILYFFRRKKVAFEFKTHTSTKVPYRPLSDAEFLAISGELQKICDECDTELKDAISYSLRMMTKKINRKHENETIHRGGVSIADQTLSEENKSAHMPYKH